MKLNIAISILYLLIFTKCYSSQVQIFFKHTAHKHKHMQNITANSFTNQIILPDTANKDSMISQNIVLDSLTGSFSYSPDQLLSPDKMFRYMAQTNTMVNNMYALINKPSPNFQVKPYNKRYVSNHKFSPGRTYLIRTSRTPELASRVVAQNDEQYMWEDWPSFPTWSKWPFTPSPSLKTVNWNIFRSLFPPIRSSNKYESTKVMITNMTTKYNSWPAIPRKIKRPRWHTRSKATNQLSDIDWKNVEKCGEKSKSQRHKNSNRQQDMIAQSELNKKWSVVNQIFRPPDERRWLTGDVQVNLPRPVNIHRVWSNVLNNPTADPGGWPRLSSYSNAEHASPGFSGYISHILGVQDTPLLSYNDELDTTLIGNRYMENSDGNSLIYEYEPDEEEDDENDSKREQKIEFQTETQGDFDNEVTSEGGNETNTIREEENDYSTDNEDKGESKEVKGDKEIYILEPDEQSETEGDSYTAEDNSSEEENEYAEYTGTLAQNSRSNTSTKKTGATERRSLNTTCNGGHHLSSHPGVIPATDYLGALRGGDDVNTDSMGGDPYTQGVDLGATTWDGGTAAYGGTGTGATDASGASGDEPTEGCYTCGLDDKRIPLHSNCYNAFDNLDARMVWRRKGYKKSCDEGATGCFKRFLDIGPVYYEKGCRMWPPTKGNSFASTRFAKLEMLLKGANNSCVFSPNAILTPFGRGISLWVRYHVCVCTGNYCNAQRKLVPQSRIVLFECLFLKMLINLII